MDCPYSTLVVSKIILGREREGEQGMKFLPFLKREKKIRVVCGVGMGKITRALVIYSYLSSFIFVLKRKII